jgi:NADPH-dependent 2,4-dienoyl-CoA reductase/sulfur reductase-like enzyme
MSARYDLAVIGAGPAGMEAALIASQAGVRTVVIDSAPQAGGQYYKPLPEGFTAARKTAAERDGERLLGRLDAAPLEKVFGALVWGIFKEESGDGWVIALSGAGVLGQISARCLVLATGAYDTPVAFPGWTLPGVISCGAALTLLKNQRIAPFRRVLVSGSGPLLLSAAAHLIDAGVKVVAVCEVNPIHLGAVGYAPVMLREMGRLREGAEYFGRLVRGKTPYRMGWSVIEACGADHVEEAVIAKVGTDGTPQLASKQTVIVDTVICGYGLTPFTSPAQSIGCKMEYHSEKGGWIPWRDQRMQSSISGVYIVGDCAGIGGAENARLEGQVAGTAVAVETGRLQPPEAENFYRHVTPKLAQQRSFGQLLADFFALPPNLISLARADTIVCRCEEITLLEVMKAVEAGARTVGEVKMITRTGMGNCQGRMCERSVAGAIVKALEPNAISAADVGRYTPRPPLHPLPLGSFLEAEPKPPKQTS